jgi:UPF0716 family protein affecting phage T7 exclusion
MTGRAPDFWTAIVAICAIAFIVSVGALCGFDHTLMKLGIAAVAGIAGFSLRGLIRWN